MSVNKICLPYNTVRNNSIRIINKIVEDGFVPNVLYVLLRGGAYMVNVCSEYLKAIKTDAPVLYAAVVARSYHGINEQSDIIVDGWTFDPSKLRRGDKILLVDDIFDSGLTINHLADIICQHGVLREDIKIAVHDYKMRASHKDLKFLPDYYARAIEINKPEDEIWIHYSSHELFGLSEEEIATQFEDEDVQAIVSKLLNS